MLRRPPAAFALAVLALVMGSCSEKITDPAAHLVLPDSLRATVDDDLHFEIQYTGDLTEAARWAWDFESDGIFDFDSIILPEWAETTEYLRADYSYSHAGRYTATAQLTTVTNRLLRATMPVEITDELPVLEALLTDSVGCGQTAVFNGSARDDAGRRAYWDLNGDGAPEAAEFFEDSVRIITSAVYTESGLYPVQFGASDNDGHVVRLDYTVTVGVPPRWESGPAMAAARTDHAAPAHGGLVYVFGGRNSGGTLASVEAYDPGAGAWSPRAAMPTARWGLEAVTVGDSIFVIGGVTAGGEVYRQLEIYEPLADTWRGFPALPNYLMTHSKQGFSALPLAPPRQTNGYRLLVFGGFEAQAPQDSSMIYDIRQERWRTLRTEVNSFMLIHRAWMGACATWNESGSGELRLLAAGGSMDGSAPSGAVESFDPIGTRWQIEPFLPTPRLVPAVAYEGGKVYACGGAPGAGGATDVVEILSLAADRWMPGPPMPLPRSNAAVAVTGGRIYVIGGGTEAHSAWHVAASADLQILVPWRCAP